MEIFGPASEEYIKKMSKIGIPVTLTVSPESGVDSVRKKHGRNYTTDEIMETAGLCKKYGITLGIHTMIALGEDSAETIRKTWKTWEQICAMDKRIGGSTPVMFAFGPMILLDPGSPAFDQPDSHGFRLVFDKFEDYYKGLGIPSWHQWISYETKYLNSKSITDYILESMEFSGKLREKYGFFTKEESDAALYGLVIGSRQIIEKVNQVMDSVEI
jgi:radical SAM superfamily enzyme YgiQ (UPF0313 family)